MIGATTWNIHPVQILTRRELACVLDDLERKAPHSANARMNRVIFRLACCCGLRVSEIAALLPVNMLVYGSRRTGHVQPIAERRRETSTAARL